MYYQIATGALFLLVFGSITALLIYCSRSTRTIQTHAISTQQYCPPVLPNTLVISNALYASLPPGSPVTTQIAQTPAPSPISQSPQTPPNWTLSRRFLNSPVNANSVSSETLSIQCVLSESFTLVELDSNPSLSFSRTPH